MASPLAVGFRCSGLGDAVGFDESSSGLAWSLGRIRSWSDLRGGDLGRDGVPPPFLMGDLERDCRCDRSLRWSGLRE